MRKFILMSMFVLAMPASMIAQDDMYFVPTKKNVAESTADFGIPRGTYYSGSDRDVDEYNRQGSSVHQIDSAGNDGIEFDSVAGVYPSVAQNSDDDYAYTRLMSRFDGYHWSDSYWAGFHDGRFDAWGWGSPWYYSSWYHSPWHYSGWFYDPWYHGWYDPWYHGWHGHWWGGPIYVGSSGGHTGTKNHLNGTGRRPLAGYGNGNATSTGRVTTGHSRNSGFGNRKFNASERFGTNRTNTANRPNTVNRNDNKTVRPVTPPRNTNSSFGSGNGFGGSRSGGGGFGGGSRSGGSRSGGFGGRR